jgi:hypothetical protein
MSAFSDYIDGLEGQTELDPLKIAHDLHNLYEQDVTTRDAKITELTDSIAERDSKITKADADIIAWKAKNFDLVMQLPGAPADESSGAEDEVDPSTLTIDDLFVKTGS